MSESQALAIQEPDDVPALVPWSKMDEERKSLLRQLCAAESLSDQQFSLLCEVALRAGLDPFRRQIYGLKIGGKFTLVVGIDGFRAVARRNGLAGMDEPVFEYIDPERRVPSKCTITVYRWGPMRPDGSREREAYTASAFMREYHRGNSMWKERPHGQLSKCTEVLALRKGFTETLGGVYERAELPESDHTIGTRVRQTERAPIDVSEILKPALPEMDAEICGNDAVDPTDSEAP